MTPGVCPESAPREAVRSQWAHGPAEAAALQSAFSARRGLRPRMADSGQPVRASEGHWET